MSLDDMRTASIAGKSLTDVARVRAASPYVWDGKDLDDKPLSQQEMRSGILAARKRRGRPVGSDKKSTTIRFDRDILDAFRAAGPGWQTRINAALRDWLKTHGPSLGRPQD
nr:BrnA antitoxin family protein [Castellaniella sp.]